jgi:phosphohistidine phosphatase
VGKKKKTNSTYDQASAVAYRMGDHGIEFCLITSSGKGKWGFPKGLIDPGETPADTALKEAEEEAGLSGSIIGKPLGNYTYNKWNRSLRVLMMLMEVSEAAAEWEESGLRERRWVGLDEAERLIDREYLRPFLRKALERLDVVVSQS